jgi:hypothetical protein
MPRARFHPWTIMAPGIDQDNKRGPSKLASPSTDRRSQPSLPVAARSMCAVLAGRIIPCDPARLVREEGDELAAGPSLNITINLAIVQ